MAGKYSPLMDRYENKEGWLLPKTLEEDFRKLSGEDSGTAAARIAILNRNKRRAMITEKDIPPEATIVLKGIYCLNAAACGLTRLEGKLVEKTHEISVTINAREALRTGYAWINHAGAIAQLGDPRALFFKLEPAIGSPRELFYKTLGVTRRWKFDPQEFDHILTEKEATDFVVGEMKRFDEVLSVAQAMTERDVIGKGEVCRCCLTELSQPTGKPSDCPRCAKSHEETEGVMKGSEECLKCEAGITYGPARLPTCFMCAHALKANHFSDRSLVRCPHCEEKFEPDNTLPGTFEEECPECETTFLVKATVTYESPTIFEKTELLAT
jgi:hypothetical protein